MSRVGLAGMEMTPCPRCGLRTSWPVGRHDWLCEACGVENLLRFEGTVVHVLPVDGSRRVEEYDTHRFAESAGRMWSFRYGHNMDFRYAGLETAPVASYWSSRKDRVVFAYDALWFEESTRIAR